MPMTAMPKDWVLDAGTLGVDFDEETTTVLSGNRSMHFKSTNAIIRLLSAPMVCGEDGGAGLVRQKIGHTTTYYLTALTAFTLIRGLHYYDSSGNFLSADTITGASVAGAWRTDGDISDVPAGARLCRAVITFSSNVTDLYVQNFLPYMMPPFGHAELALTAATVPGSGVNLQYSMFGTSASSWGSHAATANPTSGVLVHETGLYTITAWAELDDYDTTDVFQLEVTTSKAGFLGQQFNPSIAKGSLLSTRPALAISGCVPIIGNSSFQIRVLQHAGVSRDVIASEVLVQKES